VNTEFHHPEFHLQRAFYALLRNIKTKNILSAPRYLCQTSNNNSKKGANQKPSAQSWIHVPADGARVEVGKALGEVKVG